THAIERGVSASSILHRSLMQCSRAVWYDLRGRVLEGHMVKTPDRAEVALGNPSFVWRFGQDRRLNLIRQYVPLAGARILDIGCGLGVYVRKFREFSDSVYGVDIDAKRLHEGARTTPGLMLAVAEHLPFGD